MSPRDANTFLMDINDSTIKGIIAEELHAQYLAPALPPTEYSHEIHGFLYGNLSRPMVNMVMVKGDVCVNVIFLVDSGAPYSFITREVSNALNVNLGQDETYATAHGVRQVFYISGPQHTFSQVNILAADWMCDADARIHLDYGTAKSVIIEVNRH